MEPKDTQLIKTIAQEWFLLGSMLIIVRLIASYFLNIQFYDKQWFQAIFFILIGYTIFHLLDYLIISQYNTNPKYKYLIDGLLAIIIIMLTYRMLTTDTLLDKEWLMTLGSFLLLFFVYYYCNLLLDKVKETFGLDF
jgi:hypothetical protein